MTAESEPTLDCHPLTPARWDDLEMLFGPRGAVGGAPLSLLRASRVAGASVDGAGEPVAPGVDGADGGAGEEAVVDGLAGGCGVDGLVLVVLQPLSASSRLAAADPIAAIKMPFLPPSLSTSGPLTMNESA